MMAKVVVVDNNKDVSNIYADTLRCAGYDVSVINNEEEAIKTISSERPDLVLLDVLMPKINGLHILELIMKDPSRTKTRVIMLTEITDTAIRERAMKSGASDYIVKSETNITDLLQKVDGVLK